jgi:WhiB family redox-sensing transcriptional regulator
MIQWLMVEANEDLTTVAELFGRPAWQRSGACRGENVEAFIPNRGGSFSAARELCGACPVRQECFDFAMADDEVVGMWGGTTERERRAIRARRGAA